MHIPVELQHGNLIGSYVQLAGMNVPFPPFAVSQHTTHRGHSAVRIGPPN